MRLLVYPHDLQIGGSQINAIDLAASAASVGHDVYVYGIPGPLEAYIQQKGLKFIPAHPLKYRPAPTRIWQLVRIARDKKVDLIHAYEWPPCLDAYCGAGIFSNVPVLCTVLSMGVMPYVPASVPLIMGTRDLSEAAMKVQRGPVWTLEPPIDVVQDHPGIDSDQFKQKLGMKDEFLIVTVSRLAVDLKLDALVRAIDAADKLAAHHNIKLVIVGGGQAEAALRQRAAAVNTRWEREIIKLVGPLLDPRPAYAAADLVLGMGSSAMRAMSIGRPVVVQGENGFSEIFEPSTYDLFLNQGFYGTMARPGDSLESQISRLLNDSKRRHELGQFGRQTIERRFSLERAARVQLDVYAEVLRQHSQTSVKDAVKGLLRALLLEVANHDPRNKKRHRLLQNALLNAASVGAWPSPLHTPVKS